MIAGTTDSECAPLSNMIRGQYELQMASVRCVDSNRARWIGEEAGMRRHIALDLSAFAIITHVVHQSIVAPGICAAVGRICLPAAMVANADFYAPLVEKPPMIAISLGAKPTSQCAAVKLRMTLHLQTPAGSIAHRVPVLAMELDPSTDAKSHSRLTAFASTPSLKPHANHKQDLHCVALTLILIVGNHRGIWVGQSTGLSIRQGRRACHGLAAMLQACCAPICTKAWPMPALSQKMSLIVNSTSASLPVLTALSFTTGLALAGLVLTSYLPNGSEPGHKIHSLPAPCMLL